MKLTETSSQVSEYIFLKIMAIPAATGNKQNMVRKLKRPTFIGATFHGMGIRGYNGARSIRRTVAENSGKFGSRRV